MSGAHIEQLRTRLSAVVETRTALVAGRTLGALTVEQIKKVNELEEREAALHREIDELQRRASQPAREESHMDRHTQARDARAARAAARKNILQGRQSSELRPQELMTLADLDDQDARDDLEARGVIRAGDNAAVVADALRGR